MKKPALAEVELHAAKIGLPPIEAQKFVNFYESKGWKVGKSPMKQWRSAMANWKLTWEERRSNALKPTAAELVVRHEEFKRVVQKMKAIKDSYAEHQTMSEDDAVKFKALVARKKQLMTMLGMQV